MAPVFLAMKEISALEPLILLTGQHEEQLSQALGVFGIEAAANLQVMTHRQNLPDLAARILSNARSELLGLAPSYILVHGDTLSTFAVAWAAFLERIPVGHVEAGLRSHNMNEPFPEEANRRLTDVLVDLAFAPTPLAKENLIREGKPSDHVVVTGQTSIDAILQVRQKAKLPSHLPAGPFITVTMHRRENWPVLGAISRVLGDIARLFPTWNFVFPVHLNPAVREAVTPELAGIANFYLTDPLDYSSMAALLSASDVIVTDSGGLQEEGVALGVPVVVLRNVTERPEGIAGGGILLAGTSPKDVSDTIRKLLSDPARLAGMRNTHNPYGDGKAGMRVAEATAWRLGFGRRPNDWSPEKASTPSS